MLPVANNTISAFRVSSNPDVTNVSSERVILQEAAPQFNHNGGTIAGPDGLDHGGNKNDPGPGYVVKEGTLTKVLGRIPSGEIYVRQQETLWLIRCCRQSFINFAGAQ